MFPNSFPLSRPLMLGWLTVAIASGLARGQGTPPSIMDEAGMFSRSAIRDANDELERLRRSDGVAVTIQTVDSLKGQTIDEAAIRMAERLGHKGIFILIAKQEHKVEALASPRTLREELGTGRLNEIRDAIVEEFRKRRIDEGLMAGIKATKSALEATRGARRAETNSAFLPGPTPGPSGSSAGSSPLVVRQQVRLTLAGARKAIEGAEAKAVKEGWKMNIAAVDDGGHLLAFARMDGARPASVATATTKANTAATFRQASGPLGGANPDVLLNLSLQNASGGKITTLSGGIPIVVDGQVIGALGVGGGTGEQDAEVARAGVAAFLEGLQARPEESKPRPKEGEGESKPRPSEGESKPRPADGESAPR